MEVTVPQALPMQNWNSQECEVASQETSTNTSAGISRRGRICTMSRKMADFVSQKEFFGNAQMHYMVSKVVQDETQEDIFHDLYLKI